MVQQPSAFAVGHEPTILPPICAHWFVKLPASPLPDTPVQNSTPAVVTSQ
jgi:hypothetical protein